MKNKGQGQTDLKSIIAFLLIPISFNITLSDILTDDLDCMNLYIDLQETWKALANNKNFTPLGMKDNVPLLNSAFYFWTWF